MSRLSIPFPRRPLAVLLLSLAAATAYAAPIAVDLPAQALGESIKKLADLSGLSIAVDASLVSGKTAPAVKGKLEPADALRKLLEGSGLRVSFEGNKAVIGKSATVLKEVAVVGDSVAVIKEGSAEVGYRTTTAKTTGPWGDKPIQDTPYSITVVPQELIENSGARNLDQALKMVPTVQAGQPQDVNDIVTASIRGFTVTRVYVDGMANNNLGLGVFIEEMDRLEVLSGVSGFLYGISPVGGVINYQTKRPTADDLRKVTVGNYGGGQYYIHGDFGGHFGSTEQFGYRFNLLQQNGKTMIDDQNLKRHLISGAFDWHATDGLLFQLNLADKRYRLDGRQTQFYFDGEVAQPLDGTKLYAPKSTYNQVNTQEATLGATFAANEIFTLRSAYQYKIDRREVVYTSTADLINNNADYMFDVYGAKPEYLTKGAYLYLDSAFTTGGVKHKLTAGASGYRYRAKTGVFPGGSTLFESPVTYTVPLSDTSASSVNLPSWDFGNSSMGVTATSSNLNLVLADDIHFNEHWSLMLGANQSTIRAESFDPVTGVARAGTRYDKSALTPTVSLLFSPLSNVTTYLSYLESLEQGTIVGGTYKNAGAMLEPLVSKQYELGVKSTLGGVQLNGALFQIDKANQYSDTGTSTGTFVQDGRQTHRGLELTAVGKLAKEWTIVGGILLMDAEVRHTNNPLLVGKKPTDMAEQMFKLYAEYAPGFLSGWVVTGGAYFVGERFADTLNTKKVPSYEVFDLGTRYRTKLIGKSTEFRINLMNVADKRYWTAASPAQPRTLAFSANVEF